MVFVQNEICEENIVQRSSELKTRKLWVKNGQIFETAITRKLVGKCDLVDQAKLWSLGMGIELRVNILSPLIILQAVLGTVGQFPKFYGPLSSQSKK